MHVTGVDSEFFTQLAPQSVLGQHALDRMDDDLLRPFFELFTSGYGFQTAHIATVPIIVFLIPFASGQLDLVGIDDDNGIPGIGMGRVHGIVLASQASSHLGRQPPENCPFSVHYPPLIGVVILIGAISIFFHNLNLLFVVQNREFVIEIAFQVKEKSQRFPPLRRNSCDKF